MNYPSIQTAMAQAIQAIMAGGPLPPNCYIITVPIQQAQQMFPQLMMNYAANSGAMMFSQQPSYYGQLYQPQIGPYQNYQPSNALVPYSNYYPQGYDQYSNYPVVPYNAYPNKSKKQNRYGKKNRSEPHSNVYNSSSFDSDMRNLSWSRLFGNHHHRRHLKEHQDQTALSYDQKSKRRDHSADSSTSSSSITSSSSTTSDETIRRVNVLNNQSSALSSSSKQQTKSSLPFKYSSEFVPGIGKQQQQQQWSKSNRKEARVRSDDVFIVKKTEQSSSSSQQ